MAVYQPGTESELRTVLGYWNGSAREAGTANAVGDKVILPPTTITGTGGDRFLMPLPGVHILGSGSSKLSGFGFRTIDLTRALGTTVASCYANWTLDLAGLTSTAAGAQGDHGACIIEDASFAAYRWNVINSDAATGGGNNCTLTSLNTSAAVQGLMNLCDFSDANLDCLSTKGHTATYGNASSVYRAFNCTMETPGAGGSDQAASPHDNVPLNLYGCTLSGNTSGSDLAWVAAATQTPRSSLVNCNIQGYVYRAATIDGCSINLRGQVIRVFELLRDTYISGASAVTGTYAMQFEATQPSGWSNEVTITRAYELGNGGGTSLFIPTASSTVDLTVTGFGCRSKRRGLDIRNTGVSHVLTNVACEATNFGVLYNSNLTATNVVSNANASPSNPAGYTVVSEAAVEAAADAYGEQVNVFKASQPAVTDGWSNAVLAAYAIGVAHTNQYRGIGAGLRGIIGSPLRGYM